MQYKVIAASVGGRKNKIFSYGATVSDTDFPSGNAEILVQKGFLTYKEPDLILLPETKAKKGKLKVAFVTGMWKRKEVFRIFAEGIILLQKKFPKIAIQCFIAGSEGKQSEELAKSYNFNYIEYPNQPLGKKFNAATQLAMRWQPDYYMMLGSDDLISPALFQKYIEQMQKKIDYIYLIDSFFYDIRSKQTAYWGGYIQNWNKGHAAGIGRCLSAAVIQAMDGQPWLIGKYDNLLDTSMDIQLKKIKHSSYSISCGKSNCMALDIKSSVNMTPFKLWENTNYVTDKNLIEKHFGKSLANKIKACAE